MDPGSLQATARALRSLTSQASMPSAPVGGSFGAVATVLGTARRSLEQASREIAAIAGELDAAASDVRGADRYGGAR
jgi:hypothetical protein